MLSFLSYIRSKLKNDTFMIGVIFISLVLHATLTVVTPWLTLHMLDYVLPKHEKNVFWWIIMGIVFLPMFSGFLMTFEDYQSNKLGHKFVTNIRIGFFENLLKTKLWKMKDELSGQFIQRIVQDSERLAHFVYITASRLILSLLQLIIMFIFLFHINKQIGFLCFILLFIYFIPYFMFAPKFLSRSYHVMNVRAALTGFVNEGLKGVYTIKALGIDETYLRTYKERNAAHKKAFVDFVKVEQATEFFIGSVVALGIGLVYFYGGYKVLSSEMTLGVLIASKMYIENIFTSGRELFIRVVETVEKVPISKKLISDELAIADLESDEHVDLKQIDNLEIKNLSFSYDNKKVLTNFSAKIPIGKSIAIVGKSGCGKSTLLKVMTRLYDYDGEILMNDKEIGHYNLKDLRTKVILVPQHSEVISDTIWKNVTFGEAEHPAPNTLVEDILHDLHINAFVLNMPDKYNTVIGQYTNTALSGGQMQRLAIARALIKQPQILLLDESTSALDENNVAIVTKTIKKYMHDKTVLHVTHNKDVAAQSDLVFYFSQTDELMIDTHQNLLKREGYLNHFTMNKVGDEAYC